MTAVVWYRNDDLRADDHAPLLAAARADRAVAVVCVDVDLARRTQFGVGRLGCHRAVFWLECIDGLRRDLRALGGDLVVLRGRPADVLGPWLEEVGAREVHFHRGYAVDERSEEREMARRHPDVRWIGHWGNALVTPDLAPFELEDVPETFTTFRKRVEARVEIPHARPAPSRLAALPPGLKAGEVPAPADFDLTAPSAEPKAKLRYRGGAEPGRARVADYVWRQDRLRVYKETRNGLLEPDDSTKFSPWLAHGALSPRWILDQVRAYERERVANDSTYWVVFELLWRDYFKFIGLKHGARLFKVTGLRQLRLPWRHDRDRVEAWCAGETGFPLVDASMRELAATGYTSNRARQNAASFFTKVLGQDWRIGAAWYEKLLVDYDPCSNWGNWAYVAGVGNDARGFRYFHIPKQARDYDPDGAFVRHWIPEIAAVPNRWITEPHRALADSGVSVELGGYPAPIVDLDAAVNQQRRAYERADPAPRRTGRAGGPNRGSRSRGRKHAPRRG